MTPTVLIVAILGGSSLVAIAIGRYVWGARPMRLPEAALTMLAFLGLWLLCLALNVALGIAIVLTVRTVTTRFVSIYLVDDASLLIFSALQASILHAWLSLSDG
jgi:hypothetical protein